MFEQIREWIAEHQAISFVVGLGLVGAIALVLASGLFFNFDFSRSSADVTCRPSECRSDCRAQGFETGACNDTDLTSADCECSGTQSIPVPAGGCPAGMTQQGNECVSGTTSGTTPCVPVTAPSWSGGANPCRQDETPGPVTPPPFPANWPAHITLQNRSGLPTIAQTAPYGTENGYTCFGFEVPAGNEWASIDARNGGTIPPVKRSYTLTGKYFNNCPWEVEMTGGAAGSPVAGSDYIFKEDGSIEEPLVGLDELITRNTTQLIPSCWNYPHIQGATTTTTNTTQTGAGDPLIPGTDTGDDEGFRLHNPPGVDVPGPDPSDISLDPFNIFSFPTIIKALWPFGNDDVSGPSSMVPISDYIGKYFGIRAAFAQQGGCEGTYSIVFDMQFDAGRVEASLGWKHHDGVGSAPGNTTLIDGYTIVANTNRNCSGRGSEFCAGSGAGGAGGGGTSGISGSPADGGFNCGTGENSNACWCGEWGDAIWAQRHTNAACACDPGFVIDETLSGPGYSPAEYPATIGNTCGDYQSWSRGVVQEFIDTMGENFGSNQSCTPRASGVDYAGIQEAYFAIDDAGWGLSGNGSSAVAALCKDSSGTDAAVLGATCQTDGVRLDWNIPTNSVANGLQRQADGGEFQFLAGIGRFQTNFLDTDVEPGHEYVYQHKSHASVASDPVRVSIDGSGVCIVEGAPPVAGGGGDTDNDGIPDSIDPDDDNDGIPDSSDPDDDNDGIPDSQEGGVSLIPGGQTGGQSGTGQSGGQVGAAGSAQTGPAAATLMAFMLASVTVLLYVSYTHTSLFRRGEVNKLKDDQDGMDFRA